ncbi:MAG: enoyl-CoA hydratase/isomerase family protein [Bacteroidota bacterium]
MSKTYEHLLFEVEEGIATVTVNRPKKLNALNGDVLNELEDAFDEIHNRDDIKGVLLTGSGDKAFVAGADIKELSDLNSFRGTVASERGQTVFNKIESTPKPVISIIKGYALGGGLELALSTHLRVAGEEAQFGLPEVGLGLIPGYGGTQRLPRLIGKSRAMEMILTGNQVKADLALAYGLVNRMVPKGEEEKEAQELLKSILSNGPIAVSKAIKSVYASDLPKEEGFRFEAEAFGELCGTDDANEGMSAFLEKRKPEFSGK